MCAKLESRARRYDLRCSISSFLESHKLQSTTYAFDSAGGCRACTSDGPHELPGIQMMPTYWYKQIQFVCFCILWFQSESAVCCIVTLKPQPKGNSGTVVSLQKLFFFSLFFSHLSVGQFLWFHFEIYSNLLDAFSVLLCIGRRTCVYTI